MKLLMKCNKCGSYTLRETCKTCGTKTIRPMPPKFSPQDKYGKYRRRALKEAYDERCAV